VVSFVDPAQSRDVARMLELASVTPTVTAVTPGAEVVRELAESGEPVVVKPMAERDAAAGHPRRSNGGRPSGGRPRRSGYHAGSGGTSRSRNPRRTGSQDRTAAHHKQGR
jgi:hypothetical protein